MSAFNTLLLHKETFIVDDRKIAAYCRLKLGGQHCGCSFAISLASGILFYPDMPPALAKWFYVPDLRPLPKLIVA